MIIPKRFLSLLSAASLVMFGSTAALILPQFGAQRSPVYARENARVTSVVKPISVKELEPFKSISISVDEDGKAVKYDGVPLRDLFKVMMPKVKIETMPDWKALARLDLVMEVKGADGYPGLVTAVELAMNANGDRFILATRREGKPIESGVQLVCREDEYHVRWVKEAVQLRLESLPPAAGSQ